MTDVSMTDVAVVGDGPAGSALAAALVRCGVATTLVGPDRPWHATYAMWVDDVEGDERSAALLDGLDVFSHRVPSIVADGAERSTIEREYGIVDNDRLRQALRRGVTHRREVVVGVLAGDDGTARVELASEATITARLVVDATGWPPKFASGAVDPGDPGDVARQTAFGVVFAAPPAGPLGVPTVMDYRPPVDGRREVEAVASFAYALPVRDGWLVEETVLAARPAVSTDELAARLAARLDMTPDELGEQAIRTERVDIPMGVPLPDRTGAVLAFGAAASLIHPATGYSVASSLRAAPTFAAAIESELGEPQIDHARLWDALWPRSLRRTRALHDYGLDVILDLDGDGIREFFATFYALEPDRWAPYLRIDTTPVEIASIMTSVFRAASWRLRRRLVSANPPAFARMIRP